MVSCILFALLYFIIGFMSAIVERGVFSRSICDMSTWLAMWPLLFFVYLMLGLGSVAVSLNDGFTRATDGFNRWGREFLEELFP